MSLKDEIKKAVGSHGTWKRMLIKEVDTGKIDVDLAVLKADNQCGFGKWLNDIPITEKEKYCDHYHKVRELHIAFHEQASKVAQLAITGHKAGARRMLEVNGEFTATSAALTTSMLTWLTEST